MGVLPNYKTVGSRSNSIPSLTVKEKFNIALHDTTDPPIFGVAAIYAGIGQLSNQYPTWGQGLKGYSHRYGIWLADLAVANFTTEAIVPSLIHQDPRYFRKGEGSTLGRIGYAMTRVVVARNDNKKWGFNFSEIGGNAATAAIGFAYLPPTDRTKADYFNRWAFQVGSDSLTNILKEFYPDIKRKLFKGKNPEHPSQSN